MMQCVWVEEINEKEKLREQTRRAAECRDPLFQIALQYYKRENRAALSAARLMHSMSTSP